MGMLLPSLHRLPVYFSLDHVLSAPLQKLAVERKLVFHTKKSSNEESHTPILHKRVVCLPLEPFRSTLLIFSHKRLHFSRCYDTVCVRDNSQLAANLPSPSRSRTHTTYTGDSTIKLQQVNVCLRG